MMKSIISLANLILLKKDNQKGLKWREIINLVAFLNYNSHKYKTIYDISGRIYTLAKDQKWATRRKNRILSLKKKCTSHYLMWNFLMHYTWWYLANCIQWQYSLEHFCVLHVATRVQRACFRPRFGTTPGAKHKKPSIAIFF